VIFLDWRQSGAPGWIEARTGYGSIDFLLVERSGLEAVELLELQIYNQFRRRLRVGGASRGSCVVLNT
jgi:hypothetical protein